ncbi:MAG: UDP-3-O-[3-hydroxymyristoyl] N-acetylglucosamine deacetylase [Flavobacteriaceae bacterium]|nr:UDP-3-O-[3-hydroxymyristoyl] N-acetylglucosamine deacetylase [Flavobacteriaceae bacterium]|tara:strand:- start:21332 stop:22735 length:1404 start_codon:yes stop_codon:yes gene_type:complete
MIVTTKENQTTISKKISLSGVGLHTGKEVSITFCPADSNHGYVFKRTDIEGNPLIEADANYVTSTERGTCLNKNNITIQTCEHVLASLVGLEIDNVMIELNASEPPIMDGSSKFFVEALENAGIKQLNQKRKEFVVKNVISYKDNASGSEITIIPSNQYMVTTMVDFGTKILGTQNATLENISEFKDNISSCRTFSFLHEIEMLLNKGLIKGGDLNNAIVYVDKPLSSETMSKLKKAFNKDKITVKSNGILDNLTLLYPNEAARHKLLDVIGDLALIGTRVRGKVIATKPGHYINTKFSKKMKNIIKDSKKNNIPQVDFSSKPLMNTTKIMEILPHRPPFLFIDKIYELSDDLVIGVKNVTIDEDFFKGHFPEYPVMPGVIIIEAMAQMGGILVMSKLDDPENYLTFFAKIDKVRFRHKVLPGDTIIFKCSLLGPFRRGICHMQGLAYANGKLCAEAELTAQITKVK